MHLRAIQLLLALFIFSSSAGYAIETGKSTAHKCTGALTGVAGALTDAPTKHKNVAHTAKHLFLVPPPPPYVPSFLPELSYSRYYGHAPYGSSQAGPKLFKPNKYVTYCL